MNTKPTLLKGTLLITDDEPGIVDVLREILEPRVERIFTASNGKEAFAILKRETVDAVLSDIQMPQMTGLQLLAEVRHMGLQLPFVIITAFGEQKNLLEAIRLNATDFISKPFTHRDVSEVAVAALELGIAQRMLDHEMEHAFANSTLSPDEVIRIRERKKAVLQLKSTNARLRRAA